MIIGCPYCTKFHESDDYHIPRDTETLSALECDNCKQTFGIRVTVKMIYTAVDLPCQNGRDHIYESLGEEWGMVYEKCKFCEQKRSINIQEKPHKIRKKDGGK